MRIALDARTIYRPNRRGTGKNLIDLYTQVAQAKPDWEIIAFHRQGPNVQRLLPDNVKPRHFEMMGDRFDAWQRFRLPFAAWTGGADVLHCPANACPAWLPVPTVVTIHDLIPLDFPQGRPAADVQRFEQSVRSACRRAARIITPSHYTRNRLVDDFGADGECITVNEWAPDSSVKPMTPSDYAPIRRKYNLGSRCVLHFGANPRTAPRKNTRRLLEAWSILRKSLRAQWTLAIVGVDEAGRQKLTTVSDRLDIRNSVRLYDFAPEQDLPALLNCASILAYPSLSEGFGLPILDAWATDTAVLTSNTTSLPEVAGNAAHLVDPKDPCAIATGLRKLMEDSMYREQMVQRGNKRLPSYTWQSTAERFIETIDQAASRTADRNAA